jgi:prepilin-type processing-associated H-X9-DG protein
VPGGGVKVPVFMDAVWRDIPPINSTDPNNSPKTPLSPPPDLQQGGYNPGASFAGLQRACINRHSKAINVSFADGHVERVRLPDLWGLQWSSATIPQNVMIPPLPSVFAGF